MCTTINLVPVQSASCKHCCLDFMQADLSVCCYAGENVDKFAATQKAANEVDVQNTK